MGKRLAGTVLAGLALVFTMNGCGSPSSAAAGTPRSASPTVRSGAVNLIYYTIGTPDADLSKVNAELNRLLLKKLNITVQYHKIDWGEYGTTISALVNSGGNFDIAFATNPDQGDYAGNAKRGAWLDLTDALRTDGRQMYDAVDRTFWEGVKVNGRVYGVPTQKEISVPEYFIYPSSLVRKYNIAITKLNTLEALEPVLAMIKEKEPDYLPMELDRTSHNFFALAGYEYLVNRDIPLMVRSDDKNLKVVNIYESELARSTLAVLRRYYLNGYINEDAALRKESALKRGKRVFWMEAGGGPYAENDWSSSRGYPLVAHQVSPSVITTEYARGGIMVVNSRTKHPRDCVRFLNCLNTDPEVRNLMNYGIEGANYSLTPAGQVKKMGDGYSGVQYTLGNWFILKTLDGDPADKWETYQKFNRSAIKSELLGFTSDTSSIAGEISAVAQVTAKYYPCLMTGSVDPTVQLPKYLAELKSAGIDRVQSALQSQLWSWKAKSAATSAKP